MTKESARIKNLYEVLILTQEEQEKLLKKTVDWIKSQKRSGGLATLNEVSGFIGEEMPGLTRDETLALAQMAITRYRTVSSNLRKEKLNRLLETFDEVRSTILELLNRYVNMDKNEVITEVQRELYGRYTDHEVRDTIDEMIEKNEVRFDQGGNLLLDEKFHWKKKEGYKVSPAKNEIGQKGYTISIDGHRPEVGRGEPNWFPTENEAKATAKEWEKEKQKRLAGESMKEGGIGLLSGDAADVLEGLVLTNKNKSVQELVRMAKNDSFLKGEIKSQGVSDSELAGYIEDIQFMYRRRHSAESLIGKTFHNDKAGTLHLPVGDFKVISKGDPHHSGPWGSFSDLIVQDLKTKKKYSIPTGNAQLIFGLYESLKEAYDWKKITRDQFQAYEDVRASGRTNMWAVNVVMALSGLERDQITAIMQHYGELMKKYPGVRKESFREEIDPDLKRDILKLRKQGKKGVDIVLKLQRQWDEDDIFDAMNEMEIPTT